MMFEAVNGVIGSAYHFNIEFLHESACRISGLLKKGGAFFPYFSSRIRVQKPAHAEDPLQLQVGPCIQRIAHGHRHGLCPTVIFLPESGVLTCYIFLIYTVGAHCTPLIMVALKPELPEVLKAPVVGNGFGTEVAVVVNYWKSFRMFVIELAG